MENLECLEQKICLLCERYRELQVQQRVLRDEKTQLEEENRLLRSRIEAFEEKILTGNRTVEEMKQEKEFTTLFVDDLIKSVDTMFVAGPELAQPELTRAGVPEAGSLGAGAPGAAR